MAKHGGSVRRFGATLGRAQAPQPVAGRLAIAGITGGFSKEFEQLGEPAARDADTGGIAACSRARARASERRYLSFIVLTFGVLPKVRTEYVERVATRVAAGDLHAELFAGISTQRDDNNA